MSSAAQPLFGPYHGPRTSGWAQALVIPRYGYREILRSKMTLVLLVSGCVVPVVALLTIYARHNAAVLAIFGSEVVRELEIGDDFFIGYLLAQAWIAFYLALWIGPPLIARDTQDNALPLYLARPISRAEYAGGKLAILLGPLSLVTWALGLVVFAFQAAFEGMPWLRAHGREGVALVVGSWVLILTLALVVLALSAVVRRSWVARGALFGAVLVSGGVGGTINGLFETGWGDLVSPVRLIDTIWSGLFSHETWFGTISHQPQIPVWTAWAMIGLICAASVLVLARRIQAYEVVR